MENKTWILTDSDGNLPTAEEAKTFRDWMCRDKYAPQVQCKEGRGKDGSTIRCEWQFKANVTGRTMIALDAQNANLRRVNDQHVSLLEQVKVAIQANDKKAARKLLGIED